MKPGLAVLIGIAFFGSVWAQSILVSASDSAITDKSAQELRSEELCRLEGTVADRVTGSPIAGANITLTGVGSQASGGAKVSSNANGQFVVRDLPPGSYLIFAQHPSVSDPVPPFSYPVAEVKLSPGERKSVSLRAIPPASLSGRVLDEDGDPFPMAGVSLIRAESAGGARRLVLASSGGLDREGSFQFAGLPPGQYYLRAQYFGPSYVNQAFMPIREQNAAPSIGYPSQYYPGVLDSSESVPFTLKAGSQVRDIDFKLKKAKTVRLTCHISALAGVTPQFTMVNLYREGDPRGVFAGFAMNVPGRECDLGRLPQGAYTVVARAGTGSRTAAREQIVIGDQQPPAVELMLSAGSKIDTSVEWEGGAPDTSKGELSLMLTAARDISPLSGVSSILKEGPLQLGATPSGNWQIVILGVERYGYVKSIRYGDQESTDGAITVNASAPQPLRIQLSRKGGSVELTVSPQAEVAQEVIIVPEGEHVQDPWRYRNNRLTFNDQQGQPAYHFLNVPPGQYRAFALPFSDDQLINDAELLKALEKYSERITVEEGGHIRKQLKPIPLDELLDKF